MGAADSPSLLDVAADPADDAAVVEALAAESVVLPFSPRQAARRAAVAKAVSMDRFIGRNLRRIKLLKLILCSRSWWRALEDRRECETIHKADGVQRASASPRVLAPLLLEIYLADTHSRRPHPR